MNTAPKGQEPKSGLKFFMMSHDPREKNKKQKNRRLPLPERKLDSSRAGVGILALLPVSLHPVSEKKKNNNVYIFKWLGKTTKNNIL